MTVQDLPPVPEDELPPQEETTPEETPPEETPPPDSLAEAPAPPEETAIPQEETAPPPVESEPSPGKMRIFLRKALRWLIGLFIVFALGYLTAFFSLYQPLTNKYNRALDEAQKAADQVASLQAELEAANAQADALQAQIETLATERDALQEEVDAAELHFYTLRALADVQGARLALAGEDLDTARVYLSKTPAYLETMQSLADADMQDTLDDMQQRLALVRGELDDDPDTAGTDLAILADWLRQFETALP